MSILSPYVYQVILVEVDLVLTVLLKVSERRRGLSVYKFGCLIRLTLLLSSPSRRSLVRGKRG